MYQHLWWPFRHFYVRKPELLEAIMQLYTPRSAQHKNVVVYTTIYTIAYTTLPLYVPLYRCICHSTVVYTTLPLYIPLYRCICHSIVVYATLPLYTPLYRCIRNYITMYVVVTRGSLITLCYNNAHNVNIWLHLPTAYTGLAATLSLQLSSV